MFLKRLAGALMVAAATVLSVHAAGPKGVVWRVPAYSLVARAMDVREALETFGVAEGVSVVLSPAVKGAFSGNFKDVPAGDFLDRVCTMHNLTWYYDGASVFVSGAGETVTTLIDLRYMKADEVVAMLKELGVEDARFPIKTAQGGELIMVSGPPRYVTLVTEMIQKADNLREQRTFAEVETRLFPLSHTWADNVSFAQAGGISDSVSIRGVAALLQDIMGAGADAKVKEGTNKVDQASVAQPAVGVQPVIRPENRLNAVLVRDVATRMPMYERLIRQLDRPQRLVEIEVTTLEFAKNDALDWQLSLKVSGARGEFEGAAGQNAGNLFRAADLGGQGLAGAVSYLGRHVDVSASLAAMKSKGKLRNISRSTILTLNNLAASMTDRQSYHARVVGTEVATLEEVSAGTRLDVKPRIVEPPEGSTNETVWLTMQLQDGGFEAAVVDAMPMSRTSTLETQAALPVGESLLLAGYFRDVESDAGWGIPYLRDIPVIGWLFGGSSHTKETVQRLFVLTPRIVDFAIPLPSRDQAVRMRDVSGAEEVQELLDSSDDARDLRDVERKDLRERRREKIEDRLERREAEVDRDRGDRQLERRKRADELDAEKKAWKSNLKAREEAYEATRDEKFKTVK